MVRLLALVMLFGCWRESAPAREPASFVARVNARAELQRQLAAYEKRLSLVVEQIEVLRNETERVAIADDLRRIDRALTAFVYRPELTEQLQGELRRVRTELERVREELAVATSAEERAARAQLDKQPVGPAPDPLLQRQLIITVRNRQGLDEFQRPEELP